MIDVDKDYNQAIESIRDVETELFKQKLDVAIAAYNEVWENSGSIDAHNVEEIRRKAMTAALKATE